MKEILYNLAMIGLAITATGAIASDVTYKLDQSDNIVETFVESKDLEERFLLNPNVTGADVKDFLNTYKKPISVFVKIKLDKGLVHEYKNGLRSNQEQRKNVGFNHNTNKLFTGVVKSEVGLHEYEGQSPEVSANKLEQLKPNDSIDHVGPIFEIRYDHFRTPNELSEDIVNKDISAIFTDQSDKFINSFSRFLSTIIVDKRGRVVGVYFEEYGTDLDEAVLTHMMYSLGVLNTLPVK